MFRYFVFAKDVIKAYDFSVDRQATYDVLSTIAATLNSTYFELGGLINVTMAGFIQYHLFVMRLHTIKKIKKNQSLWMKNA